jgi:hypothetical protein
MFISCNLDRKVLIGLGGGIAIKDIGRLNLLMMFGCMVLAGVVGSVEDAFAP